MMRMFSAYMLSLLLSIIIGVAMARNKYVESFLLPILDVLQSIPILGFFPIALILLIQAVPGELGVELAIIFLITTSMIWNMIFGVYSSIKSLDPSIYDLMKVYKFNPVISFFRIYIPASIKAIVANSIISWAGGWFFITSSEIIATGTTEIKVLGIGTYILDSFVKGDIEKMYIGIVVLVLSVLATYIFLWNPMFEETGIIKLISCNVLYKNFKKIAVRLYDYAIVLVEILSRRFRFRGTIGKLTISVKFPRNLTELLIVLSILVVFFIVLWNYMNSLYWSINVEINAAQVLLNLILSLSRVLGVVVLSLLLSLILSYYSYITIKSEKHGFMYIVLIGEILASIPAVLWWPILSSLMKMGSLGVYMVSLVVFLQGSLWYSFFNLMLFGISSLRKEVVELADVYGIKGKYFIRHIFIPILLPSIATGMISSWGGAWNSIIVAEYFSTDNVCVNLGGIGALMNEASSRGNVGELIILVTILSLVIAVINKSLWSRLFRKLKGRYLVE